MGKRIITNFKDEYKLWSSNSEDYIAEFDNKKDLLNFIALEKVYDAKLKAIEILIRGFDKMSVDDSMIYIDNNRETTSNEYFDFVGKINLESKTYEEYYKAIDDKLEELMK